MKTWQLAPVPLAWATALWAIVLSGSSVAAPAAAPPDDQAQAKAQATVKAQGADKTPARGRAALDLSAWRTLPVLHNGRVMPLDTYARQLADQVTGRERPKLGLKGAVPADDLASDDLAAARELFPSGEPRTFDPAELLLSWMTEPESWEDVPFLVAEHEELRTKYLELPVTNEKGKHLRYVSPRQVMEAVALHERRDALASQQREARMAGKTFQPAGVDEKLLELIGAYTLFRQISHDPSVVETMPMLEADRRSTAFLERLQAVVQDAAAIRNDESQITTLLRPMLEEAGHVSLFGTRIEAVLEPVQELRNLAGEPSARRDQVEPLVEQALAAADSLVEASAAHRKRVGSIAPNAGDVRSLLRQMHSHAVDLQKDARAMQTALYGDSNSLNVVPALNSYALERDREMSDDSQPWLSLGAVVYGSPRLLSEYPSAAVERVRAAYPAMQQAYLSWRAQGDAESAKRFAESSQSLTSALRVIGEDVGPKLDKLPVKNRDEDLIAYIQYPPAGSTVVEVRYNRLQPFFYSWIISLAALVCFSLSFGVLRKPMFWLGMSILGVGLGWAVMAFAMRVMITGWAPVTNMYETVVFVPFVVSLLGAWFALAPLTSPGVALAWRLSAVPRGDDEEGSSGEAAAPLSGSGVLALRMLMLLGRAALAAVVFWTLAIASYAAGDQHVINLLPQSSSAGSLPDFNSLLTWAVGLGVLAFTMWFVPRVVVTGVVSAATIPLTAVERTRDKLDQVYRRWPFAITAAFVGFLGAFVAWYSPVLDESIKPLQPVLRDNFWLTIHVLIIVSSYAAGALAWGLGNIALAYYLFGRYRPAAQRTTVAGHAPAGDWADQPGASPTRRAPEACTALAGYTYKAMQVAVLLLVAGTILGGLWADVSWGRFWGWDPKEVWALISGLVYLAILHGRYAGLFGNFGLAIGSVLGASAIVFSWYGVNFVLGEGLHSYGFGAGGQREVFTAVAVNWLFAGAAGARYFLETRVADSDNLRSHAETAEPHQLTK